MPSTSLLKSPLKSSHRIKGIKTKPGDLFTRSRSTTIHFDELSAIMRKAQRSAQTSEVEITSELSTTTITNKAQPRTGLGQYILDMALQSPLWKNLLVPQARSTMIKTAEANGIPWISCKTWIQNQDGPWSSSTSMNPKVQDIPEYYNKPFHAYEEGNLSWDAAFEQEIASRAVGARNFPKYGSNGEDAFRSSFEYTLINKCDARIVQSTQQEKVDEPIIVLDMGCGTGISTRRLASLFPTNSNIHDSTGVTSDKNGMDNQNIKFIGVDLSPYFIQVGQWLLKSQPRGLDDNGPWVTTIRHDSRISFQVGDITNITNLSNQSVNVVNIMFVLHEMPFHAIRDVIDETFRLLKPGGQLWISEMDFDSPAYAAQRSNPLLFSLLRATEPFLDQYADNMNAVREYLASKFESVVIEAATGRHYALVATKKGGIEKSNKIDSKNVIDDRRFTSNGSYCIEDTHLMLWESKDNSKNN